MTDNNKNEKNKKNIDKNPSSKKKVKKKSSKKSKKNTLKIVLISILVFMLTVLVIGGAVFLGIVKTAPSIDIKALSSFSEPTKFYDDKGTLIDEYLTVERRDPVKFNDIPKTLRDSFISIEDERFEKHNGIDFRRLAGATLGNVKSILTGKKNFQGGSTITQQLIKQKYFLTDSLNNRLSIKRKIQEMAMAMQLEKKLSKEKILEMYLNTIPLGGNAYGVKSAAKQYFNKDLKDLTVTECAFIASCAQSPSVSYGAAKYAYDNKEVHESPRTKAVLAKLLENNKISQAEYDKAITPQLKYSFTNTSRNKMNYEWFSRPVIEDVMDDLKSKYNYTDNEVNALLANGGLEIHTTMDTSLQKKTQEILNDTKNSSKTKSWQYTFPRNSSLQPLQKNLQASATVVDYHTGQVKAIVGGRGEQNALSYNRAASDKFLRPPGSAQKPLTVYSPAIETKKFTAASILDDNPLPMDLQTKYSDNGKPYNPKNSGNSYIGKITLRNALKKSSNVIAIRVVDEVGLDVAASYGTKFGLKLLNDAKKNMPSMALGQLDTGTGNGTNPLTLSAAYGAFGNEGKVTKPILYTKIIDNDGKILLENKTETKQAITPQTAFIMYDMLKEPVSSGGTGPSANFGTVDVRGKTGTSSTSKDLWFAGLTPHYAATVWVGNDNNEVIKGMGSNDVAKLWGEIMKEANKGKSNVSLKMPEGVVYKNVSNLTGNVIKDLGLIFKGSKGYKEYFLTDTYQSNSTSTEDMYVTLKVVKKPNGTYVLASSKSDPSSIEVKTFIKKKYAHLVGDNDTHLVEPTEYDEGTNSAPSSPSETPPSNLPEDDDSAPSVPEEEDTPESTTETN